MDKTAVIDEPVVLTNEPDEERDLVALIKKRERAEQLWQQEQSSLGSQPTKKGPKTVKETVQSDPPRQQIRAVTEAAPAKTNEPAVQTHELPQGKVVSPAKLAANRRNAQLSTGPRSNQGKKWSRRNATKHGILSSVLLIDGKEDEAVFQERLSAFRLYYQPEGPSEELLVEDIAICGWRLRRAHRFEAQAITRSAEREFLNLSGESAATPEEMMQLLKDVVEEADNRARARAEDIRFPLGEICSSSKDDLCARLKRVRAKRYLDICSEQDVRAKARELGVEQYFEAAIAARAQQSDGAQWANPIPLDTRLVMPSEEDQNRILRYESIIYRRLTQSMNQLERLQRSRKGEHVPAPLHLNLSTGA